IDQRHYHDRDHDDCAAQAVAAIKKWKSEKLPLEACAILLRDRHQSVAIENALMHAGIAYRTQGMQGYLQREELVCLRGMMAIALKNLSAVQSEGVRKAIVESLAIFGEIGFNAHDMDFAKNAIAQDPDILNSFFSGQLQRSRSDKARARISDAVSYMETLLADAPAGA